MRPTEAPGLEALPGGAPPLEARADDELMQLARAGLDAALATLIRRHQGAVRAYCARVCGSALADDVAQEAFLALWARRNDYEARGRFRAYLFTLVEKRALNVLRSGTRRRRKHEAARPETLPEPDQLDALLDRERQEQLYALVDELPGEQRRAIWLRYAGGLEYAEIAEIVARPEATVRTRVFLGLKRLRATLRERGES
jgi:RNA polymerase sigma-70 factor (ECF subfamily)